MRIGLDWRSDSIGIAGPAATAGTAKGRDEIGSGCGLKPSDPIRSVRLDSIPPIASSKILSSVVLVRYRLDSIAKFARSAMGPAGWALVCADSNGKHEVCAGNTKGITVESLHSPDKSEAWRLSKAGRFRKAWRFSEAWRLSQARRFPIIRRSAIGAACSMHSICSCLRM